MILSQFMSKKWLALMLLVILPMVIAVNEPIFENAMFSYKNAPHNLSWAATENAIYSMSVFGIEEYNGLNSYYVFPAGYFTEGNFTIGVNATLGNESNSSAGWLYYAENTLPTKPVFTTNSPADISFEPVEFIMVTPSVDVDGDSILYILRYGSTDLANFTGLDYNLSSFSEGIHSFRICAFDGYNRTCSDPVAVSISNTTIPQIKSISYGYGIPFYSNLVVRKVSVTVVVQDARPVTVVASFAPSDNDYYEDIGDEDENLNFSKGNMSCVEVSNIGNTKEFNCSGILDYRMQPGLYSVLAIADNGFRSSQKTFTNRINVGGILSAEVISPLFDFENTYNDWTGVDPPLKVENTGNIPFSDVGVEISGPVECDDNIDFSINKTMFGERDNRGAAVVGSSGFKWLGFNIPRGYFGEIFYFLNYLHDDDDDYPTDCEAEWDLKLRYVPD